MTQPPLPPQQPMQFQMQPVVPGSGMGTASLVLGIIAFVVMCVPPLAWLLAVVAIILGVVSIAQAGGAPTGKAKAGMVLGIIAIAAGVGIFIAARAGMHAFGNFAQQKNAELQQKAAELEKNAQDASQKIQEQSDKMNEQIKKQQQMTTQPGVMLTHPEGWSVYVA
jgi:hypothetical protein